MHTANVVLLLNVNVETCTVNPRLNPTNDPEIVFLKDIRYPSTALKKWYAINVPSYEIATYLMVYEVPATPITDERMKVH